MAYRFKRKESVPEAVRRIVSEQMNAAARRLEGEGDDIHEAVHEARKSIKKTRSLLRLLRGELGSEVYKTENARLRGAARRLSGARDAAAVVETLDKLLEARPEEAENADVMAVHGFLTERRDAAAADREGLREQARESARELACTPARVDHWPLTDTEFAALARGYRRSYKRGRKAHEAAVGADDDDLFHALRKRVKDQWYHTRLLRRAWRRPLRARAKELKRLADLLGDDHDLAVLRGQLREAPGAPGAGSQRVSRLALERQGELRGEAQPLARRVYGAKPRCREQEMAQLWRAWRGR